VYINLIYPLLSDNSLTTWNRIRTETQQSHSWSRNRRLCNPKFRAVFTKARNWSLPSDV